MALYDPKEFPGTETRTPTLVAAFLAWARTKPTDLEYCYYDAEFCAVGQFGTETGRDHLVNVGNLAQQYPELDRFVNPPNGEREWTFGALVERLEAAL